MSHTIKARKLSDRAPLTDAQLAALKAFAKDEGRRWKTVLNEVYWYNARIWRDPKDPQSQAGYILHGLRNSHGPSWLDSFRLPRGDA